MDGHVVQGVTITTPHSELDPKDLRIVEAFHRFYLAIGDMQYGEIDKILWVARTGGSQIDLSVEAILPEDGEIRLRSWLRVSKATKIESVHGWVEGVGSFSIEQLIRQPATGNLRLTISKTDGLRLTQQ